MPELSGGGPILPQEAFRSEALPQPLYAISIRSEIGMSDPRGRAEIDPTRFVIDHQLEVIDEPEETTG